MCVGIGPWNYPFQIACWKSAPALACGKKEPSFPWEPAQSLPHLCTLTHTHTHIHTLSLIHTDSHTHTHTHTPPPTLIHTLPSYTHTHPFSLIYTDTHTHFTSGGRAGHPKPQRTRVPSCLALWGLVVWGCAQVLARLFAVVVASLASARGREGGQCVCPRFVSYLRVRFH